MNHFLKRTIGDVLSVLTGNNDEDYEPTKDEYMYFWLMLFFFILTGIALSC